MIHDGRDQTSLQQFQQLAAAHQQDAGRVLELHPPEAADHVISDCWKLLKAREAAASDAGPDQTEPPEPAGDLWSTASLSRTPTAAELDDQPEEITDDGRTVVMLVRNIGQFRNLRKDDDDFGMGSFGAPKAVTPASRFSDLIRRGPQNGIHVVIWSDTFANLIRWISTGLLREFDYRIAFRLNQTDSASLLDTPAAATLVPGRAILYQDQTGESERFRPWQWVPAAPGREVVTKPANAASYSTSQAAAPAVNPAVRPSSDRSAAAGSAADSTRDLPEFPDIDDLVVV